MKIEPESMSKEEYESFVSEFKNAQLLLPVEIYSKTQSDEINEPLSFKPVTIEENGCKCIPLFTDNEELKKDNPPVSVIAIFMKDLKDMLEDSSEIDEIMINPSSKDTVCIALDSFFDLFEVRNNPNDWIFEKSMPPLVTVSKAFCIQSWHRHMPPGIEIIGPALLSGLRHI